MRAVVGVFVALFVLPATTALLFLTAWVADRDPPAEILSMWIDPKEAKACSDVDLWVERQAFRQTGLRLEVFMTDSHMQSHIPLVTGTSALRGPVGYYKYSVGLHVPCTFKPGWVTVERRVSYNRNPFHKYLWPIEGATTTARFCVIADGQRAEEVCKP